MTPSAPDTAFIPVQVCTDQLSAEVLANGLRLESVPTIVRSFGGVPGLEQGIEVLVPAALLHRARWIIARPAPSDAELAFLATGKLLGDGDPDA